MKDQVWFILTFKFTLYWSFWSIFYLQLYGQENILFLISSTYQKQKNLSITNKFDHSIKFDELTTQETNEVNYAVNQGSPKLRASVPSADHYNVNLIPGWVPAILYLVIFCLSFWRQFNYQPVDLFVLMVMEIYKVSPSFLVGKYIGIAVVMAFLPFIFSSVLFWILRISLWPTVSRIGHIIISSLFIFGLALPFFNEP